jgi:hypothetical protein
MDRRADSAAGPSDATNLCSVATPSNLGQSCNSCSGTYQCNGSCSSAEPAGPGTVCAMMNCDAALPDRPHRRSGACTFSVSAPAPLRPLSLLSDYWRSA